MSTPRKSGIYGCINHALPLLRERRKFAILVNDLLRFGIPIAAAATGQVKPEACGTARLVGRAKVAVAL